MSCEDNHKKDGHLWALIAKIENLIIITIKKKMVRSHGGYGESWFFHFAYPKHVQLLIKTILQGKFQLITSSQFIHLE
jgi:hypothetical protein